jgi:predicted TIM-barrel fold metal-dependent hydrolase
VINDAFVIDAATHAFDLRPETYRQPLSQQSADIIYHGLHCGFQPAGETRWLLEKERFLDATDPRLLGHALFQESSTDMCVYHAIGMHGLYSNGLSPLRVATEMRDLYPGRVLIYGGVSPWQDGVLDEIDRLVEEEGVVGLKIYPHDIIDGRIVEFRLDDREAAYPLIDRARARGLRTIAMQKSQPIGPVPLAPYAPTDVEGAAIDFPEMNFELVHGGWAFLEETASQLARFPNVSVNLEITTAYLLRAPRRFAEILGSMLAVGGGNRLLWSSGAMLFHPRPYLEAFWDFEIPRDLVEDYGFPELTDADKVNILGANQARILGLDVEALKAQLGSETEERRLAEPWSSGREPVAAGGEA